MTPSDPASVPAPLVVAIVAPSVSARFGGEAILPLQYFRRLRARGVDAYLVCHERTRDELAALLGPDIDRVRFVRDTALHRRLNGAAAKLKAKLGAFLRAIIIFDSQRQARAIVRDLVRTAGVNVVHQPAPVSPKQPTMLHSVGAPVIVGPMNGGMTYPPAFRNLHRPSERVLVPIARAASGLLNLVMPGKRRAATLVVANDRSRRALPAGVRGEVVELVENGVDLSLFRTSPDVQANRAGDAKPAGDARMEGDARREDEAPAGPALASSLDPQSAEGLPARSPVRFLYAGRLERFKAVDLLLDAWARFAKDDPTRSLQIIGDGPDRAAWEAMSLTMGLRSNVRFVGFARQADVARAMREADVFVLPSLQECGGAVVLEAMASGLPVIAIDWGGPSDYLDSSCGILVRPDGREAVVGGLESAMQRLAGDAALRDAMGRAGRAKVEASYDWERKVDRMLELYAQTRRLDPRRMAGPIA